MNKKERIIIDGIDVTDCNFIITPKKQCPAKSMPYEKKQVASVVKSIILFITFAKIIRIVIISSCK